MPASRSFAFITQLSATPPAIARLVLAGALAQPGGQAQHGLLQHQLHGGGQVQVALVHRRTRHARRTEPRHQVQRQVAVLTVGIDDQVLAQHVDVARLAHRRHRHHLVLVARMQEAEVGRDPLIHQAERMRHLHLAQRS